MIQRLVLLLAALVLTACADGQRQLEKPVEPLGNFRLGHAEVVAPNLVKGPVSRDASPEEWIAAVDAALEERFDRYEGDSFYHLGVSVEGYVLAQPGVPLVFSPKSALIMRVTVWDDASRTKLNAETHQVTVLESFSAETVVGSGLTQSKEQQMRNLAANAALQVETWMRKMAREEGWFTGEATDDVRAETVSETGAASDTPSAPGSVTTSAAPSTDIAPATAQNAVVTVPPALLEAVVALTR